jgi:hypothetical protein
MKTAKVRTLLTAIVLLLLSVPALAESRRIMGGSAGGSKYQFFYETFLDPATPELGNMGGGTIGGEGTIHRFMSDRRQRVFFGYDVQIEGMPDVNAYRVTFSQLAPESIRQILGNDAASWTQLPAPDWGGPETRTIRAGEVLALDLLTNNATGQKIVDYITVKGPSFDPSWRFIYETGTAQDFRVEDATLQLFSPHVSVNGQEGQFFIPTAIVVNGPTVWFYLPDHGRFILSLLPQPDLGFVKAGEIRGTTLTFTMGDDTYNLVSAERIAPGQHPFNLYVRHEPDWRPPDGKTSVWAGGSASTPDELISK